MSIFEQQAFQQSIPLRHWNWMVVVPSSNSGMTGLSPNGDSLMRFMSLSMGIP